MAHRPDSYTFLSATVTRRPESPSKEIDSPRKQGQTDLNMKAKLLIPGLLGGLLCVQTAAQAQNRPGPNDRPGGQPNIRELFLKQFDKNGNGRIEENERPSREQIQDFFRKQQGNQTTPGRPGAGDPNQRPGGPGQRPGGRPGEPGQGGQGGRPGFGGPGQGGFPGRPGGGFQMPNPVLGALDANRDGEISADEIKNAAKALSKLDRNRDGKLSREELRPQFGRPGGEGRPDFRPRPGGEDRPNFRPDRRPGEGRPDFRPRPGAPGQGRPDGPSNQRGPRPDRPDRSEA